MAGSRHLLEAIESYRHRLAWLNPASAEQRGVDAWDDHAEVLQAIAAQEEAGASELGRAHLREPRLAFARSFLDGELSAR